MNRDEKKLNIQIQHEYGSKGKSRLQQYQDLVIGSRSLWFLTKFELITLFCSRVPGALGILLRKTFYPMILGKVGHGVVFGTDVWFRHPMKIKIGDRAIVDDGAFLDAKGDGNHGIRLGNNCYIGRGSILSCKDGNIEFEDFVNISTWCNISSNSDIVIGEKTLLGPYASIFATSHNFDDVDEAVLDHGWTSKGVKIGKNCWIGARVTVLDGVDIGDNVVLGAGALVNKDIQPNVVAIGAPAKVVKERK
ncbi:hypothetical protein MNBD_NITROSPINAE01-570 [hydrothermal vent metagenome]|uniref:Uncharacterized protein n=1 Tax=hydrothermal vent metagenome TaxID=652676 RepID=A0A3B1BSU3_9ZZZZ